MLFQPIKGTKGSISKSFYINTFPITQNYYETSFNLMENIPNKNITIYSNNFAEKFNCNFFLAKAAFPDYFQNNIERLISSNIREEVKKKIFDEYPQLNSIRALVEKRNELNFEKLSFENRNQESFFLISHPNADRSEERKRDVIDGIKSISDAIISKSKNLKIEFLYVHSLNPRNIDEVRNFLCNMKYIQSFRPPPKLIDSNFYENLKEKNFEIIFHGKQNQSSKVFINPIAGFSFSKIISNSDGSHMDIEIKSNPEIFRKLLDDLISFEKVSLQYINYPVLKEISEIFNSKYLKRRIQCFEKNTTDLNNVFEKVKTLSEIQRYLFSINEYNFEEVNTFIELLIQQPCFKQEIAHQITNASRFNPKANQLYKQLSLNIEKYFFDHDFQPKIWEYSFSPIEKILMNDDLHSFQNFISTDSQINIEKNLFYCSRISKNIELIKIACFYGAIKCFKYLLSRNLEYDESKLLPFAIAGGNIEIMRLLNITEKKDIPNARSFAALYHQNTIFDWLIENEIDNSDYIEKASESNNFYAAQIYFEQNFGNFIEKEDSFDEENPFLQRFSINDFHNALKKALLCNHESFFCFLLNFPCADMNDIIQINDFLNTAIKSGNIRLIDFILSFGDEILKHNSPRRNQEMLLTAIETANIEIVKKIYNLKGIKNLLDNRIDNYEELADSIIFSGNKEIIQMFIPFGNIFRYDVSIENIITHFVHANDIKSIENIVDKDYFKIRKDWSPFPVANDLKMIQYLIDCKSEINYCNEDGKTCLLNAIENNDIEIIQFLLKNNAIVRKIDYDLASDEIKEILDPYYDG